MATQAYEISVDKLTYAHAQETEPSLSDVNLHLPKGSRTILVGANGGAQSHSAGNVSLFSLSQLTAGRTAGKSTLLQLLAGKRLISTPGTDVRIKGRDVFRNSPPGITFLGTEWCGLSRCVCRPAR